MNTLASRGTEPAPGLGEGSDLDPAYTAACIAAYTLRLGDDALILAQRLSEWVAAAPELEEDVALANISLDLLGQARLLLAYAGTLDADPAGALSEDDLAFLRDERSFVNCLLVEQPNGDFAATIARQLFFASYQYALYECLQYSSDEQLAAIAAKAVKEVAYHRDHATMWTLRLGDGTDLSRARMQKAVDQFWPLVSELFESDEVTETLSRPRVRVAVDPASLRPAWDDHVRRVLGEATLEIPDSTPPESTPARRGRAGLHTEQFGYLLAEMQYLHRSFPGATW